MRRRPVYAFTMWRRARPRISEFLQLVLITATLAAIAAAFAVAGILSRPWGAP